MISDASEWPAICSILVRDVGSASRKSAKWSAWPER